MTVGALASRKRGTQPPPPPVTADFYVDSGVAGNDSNNGTSSITPFKTLAHATSVMAANKVLAMARNSVFRETMAVTASGQQFTDYGAGAKPIVTAMGVVSSFSAVSGNIYNKTSVTTQPFTVTYTLSGITTQLLPASSPTAPGPNQFGWSANVLYVNVGGDPSAGVIEAGVRTNCMGSPAANQGLSFTNIRFTGSNGNSNTGSNVFYHFGGNTSSGHTFTGCEFAYSSGGGIFVAAGTGNASTNYASNITFTGCLFEWCKSAGFDGGPGIHDMHVLHSEARYCCWGVPVFQGGVHVFGGTNSDAGFGGGYSNFAYNIEFGWINSHHHFNDGAGAGINSGKGLYFDEVGPGCSIHHCNTHENGSAGIMLEHNTQPAGGAGTQIYSNIVWGNCTNSGIVQWYPSGILIYRGTQNSHTYQNTVYGNHNGNGITVLGDPNDHNDANLNNIVENNISFGNVGQDLNCQQGGNNNGGTTGGTNGSGNVYDYNCFGPSPTIGWGGSAYSSDANFSSGTGQAVHDVRSDPLLVSTGTNPPNLHETSSSPCRTKGTASGIATDNDNFNFTSPPDIGAYQFH